MFKNVASQKITLLAIDTATNLPKTGDAANITAYVSKDDGAVTVLGDTSATETDATNAPGLYIFDLTQGETNADKAVFSGKSSTSGVRIVPVTIYTLPASFTSNVSQTGDAYSYLTTNLGALGANLSALPKTGFKLASDGLASVVAWSVAITGNITGNLSGSVGSLTGYTSPPSAATIAAAVWDALTSAAVTAGSFGVLAKTYIDAAISSRLATSGYTAPPSAATIAAAVWDYLTSAAITVGSFGKLLVDNINATISSRLAGASYTAPDNSGISAAATSAAASATSAASAATSAAAAATSAASADTKATTILSRLGSWTGSAANTILGAFKALASKTATLPSDLSAGGTDYDNTTDALQALRDRGDAAWITGGGGGGGGTTILNIVPSTTGVGDVTSDTITAYLDAEGNATVIAVDSEGTEIPLPDDCTFTVEYRKPPHKPYDVFTKAGGTEVAISSNEAAVTWAAADISSDDFGAGDYCYSLRDTDTGRVYAEGVFRIKRAALAD